MGVKNKTLTLTFGASYSKNYNLAVELAKKFPSYKVNNEGKDITHSVTFSFDQISELRELLDLVGQWKSTAVYIDNQMVSYSKIARVLYCYSERQRSFNLKDYCYGKDDARSYNDNDFGCRHCGVNSYAWDGLSEFGEMQKNGDFIVNKDKMLHIVTNNLEPFLLCPALDFEKVKKKIEEFPSVINPKRNKNWEYVTEWDDNTEKEIAVSVRKKDSRLKKGYVLDEYNSLDDADDFNDLIVKASKPKTLTFKKRSFKFNKQLLLGPILFFKSKSYIKGSLMLLLILLFIPSSLFVALILWVLIGWYGCKNIIPNNKEF